MTTLDFNSVPSDPYANTGTVIYILGHKALTLQHKLRFEMNVPL